MSDDKNAAAPALTPVAGGVILLLVIAIVVGWSLIGGKLLGITSFFASFLFLWYWAAVEHADFSQWLQSVAGALFGLLLAWQLSWLPVQFPGGGGLAAALIVLLIATYVQIMNWAPMVCNRAAMLFLTILAAPAILERLDVRETAMAIGLGAVFIGGAIKVVTMLAPKPDSAGAS